MCRPDGIRRREFLQAASVSALSLKAVGAHRRTAADMSCILLMLVGGPSQLDTWDMKPDAPSHIRGPFRPIRTNVPGIEISEIFPRMAKHADKYSLIRSVYDTRPAIHDAGHLHVPSHFLSPNPDGENDALDLREEPPQVISRYGGNRFGRNCLRARRLIEAGVRIVTVNMFGTVFDENTWDVHGPEPFTSMNSCATDVAPVFDNAYSALLEDLSSRGLLSTTIVVAAGEFGRTPWINSFGGRDHWTQCWTVLMGGGPLKGGTVVGSSDSMGAEPKDRPVHVSEIAATICSGLGIPRCEPGAEPISELFA